jgi:hypothetical protein
MSGPTNPGHIEGISDELPIESYLISIVKKTSVDYSFFAYN